LQCFVSYFFCVTGKRWKKGDIVGALLDMDLLEMTFYLNGENLGPAFNEFWSSNLEGLYPTISLNVRQHVRVNFGQFQFRYPPDKTDGKHFRPVSSLFSRQNQSVTQNDSVKSTQSYTISPRSIHEQILSARAFNFSSLENPSEQSSSKMQIDEVLSSNTPAGETSEVIRTSGHEYQSRNYGEEDNDDEEDDEEHDEDSDVFNALGYDPEGDGASSSRLQFEIRQEQRQSLIESLISMGFPGCISYF
jgi:hypothetical protein